MSKSMEHSDLMKSQSRPHLEFNPENWPIYSLSTDRAGYVSQIVDETTQLLLAKKGDPLQIVKGVYNLENRRMAEGKWKVDPPNEGLFWSKIRKQITSIDQLPLENENRQELTEEIIRKITRLYAEEIAGNFKPSMFRFARKVLRNIFKILFNKFNEKPFAFWGGKKSLENKIRIVGHVDQVRNLNEEGTIVFVPTHSSNLDSIFLGYSLDMYMGLPGFYYGAGLNLFNSEIIAYAMNRLGTYRVDRRKKNLIYLETLKMSSRVAIKKGVNSLFFPGGTRSRSGEVESKLKLGLMTTTIDAQREMLDEKKGKVIIVPVVVNYPNVFEGHDLLKEFIRKNEAVDVVYKKIRRPKFFKKTRSLIGHFFNSKMINYISIGKPMDVFGNELNAEGESITKNGKIINLKDYFVSGGKVKADEQRSFVYTKQLAEVIVKAFKKNVVVRSSHLCALTFMEIIKDKLELEVYEDYIQSSKIDWSIDETVYFEKLNELRLVVIEENKKEMCFIDTDIPIDDVKKIAKQGFEQLCTFHSFQTLKKNKGMIITDNPGLIIYYANRLKHMIY